MERLSHNITGTPEVELKVTSDTLGKGTPWYLTYPTTSCLLLLIHAIYFTQIFLNVNCAATSYYETIVEKKFYRILPAILSHPPIRKDNNDRNNDSSSMNTYDVELGNRFDQSSSMGDGNYIQNWRILKKIKLVLGQFTSGKFSGLPLLLFITHIICYCRSLEEIYSVQSKISNSEKHPHYSYIRVLLVLVTVPIALQMSICKFFTTFSQYPRIRLIGIALSITKRYCSLTALSTALLVVFTNKNPHASLSFFPAFGNIAFYVIPSSAIGFIANFLMLAFLSVRICGISDVIFGAVSGILWIDNITTFLAINYWNNWLLAGVLIASALSYKHQHQLYYNNRAGFDWLPCINFNTNFSQVIHLEVEQIFSRRNENDIFRFSQ